MFGLDGLKIGGGGGGMGYTDCCACARSIATHAPKTHAHPTTKNFAGSIRIAISFEPMFTAFRPHCTRRAWSIRSRNGPTFEVHDAAPASSWGLPPRLSPRS